MKCFWSDCQEFGINYVSINDIVSLNATVDARACQMACAFRSECRFWTHFKDTNVCNLKADYTLRAVIEHLVAAYFPDKHGSFYSVNFFWQLKNAAGYFWKLGDHGIQSDSTYSG